MTQGTPLIAYTMDETKIDVAQVKKGVCALLEYTKKVESKTLNALTDESEHVSIQLGFKKVPNVKNKTVKVQLPSPLVKETTDVCLFVKDLDKANRDFAPTIEHYKELLESKGVSQPIEVIPLKNLKIEYQPYEAKRSLSNMYEVFLADDRIMRLLPPQLGKAFYSRKRYPMQVNLKAGDLKKEISKALSTSQCIIGGRGSSCQMKVGLTSFTEEDIVANINAAVLKLSEALPGGVNNIRNIHVKTDASPSIPVYISLGSSNDVDLPKKEKKVYDAEPEDVTTVFHGKVRVTPFGDVRVMNKPMVEKLKHRKPESRKRKIDAEKSNSQSKKKDSLAAKKVKTDPEVDNDVQKNVKEGPEIENKVTQQKVGKVKKLVRKSKDSAVQKTKRENTVISKPSKVKGAKLAKTSSKNKVKATQNISKKNSKLGKDTPKLPKKKTLKKSKV